ncbi:MAG: glycine--tRNA ligase subunit beta [Myxococcales bacterium]|nr:glycine--tRNA ligase subunit beta [Myxococcales bacterium]
MSVGETNSQLLLEVGVEELPPGTISSVVKAFDDRVKAALESWGLQAGSSTTYATPRRIAVQVSGVQTQQPDRSEMVLGPPVSIAYDDEGNPSPAAAGFARKVGVEVDKMSVQPGKRGDVLAAEVHIVGQSAVTLLADALPEIIGGLPFPKKMRWEASGLAFSRPIRWVLAVLGDQTIPFTVGDVQSSNQTEGHRFLAPGTFVLESPDSYQEALRSRYVLADMGERKSRIEEGLAALETNDIKVVPDPALVDTVTNLVEWPETALGSFPSSYLALPREVLITELRQHQKIFAIEDANGSLVPHFAVVMGTQPADVEGVLRGNARVIRARLEDGQFFYDEDRKTRLEDRIDALDKVLYLKGLGSVKERTERLVGLSRAIAEQVLPDSVDDCARTAHLAKADLVTLMVNEFAELQGIMGRYYALHDGESETVAQAIEEHYRPRFSGDAIPGSTVGAVVALADKVDAIAGCFAVGLIPKGSQDPYALRRAAIGILRILEDTRLNIGFRGLLTMAFQQLEAQGVDITAGMQTGASEFVEARVRVLYSERYTHDLVDAVLAVGCEQPHELMARIEALQLARTEGWFDEAAVAFKRIQNISRDHSQSAYDTDQLVDPAEKALDTAFRQAQTSLQDALSMSDHKLAISILGDLRPSVDTFFDEVLVMADDPGVRNNRLSLLRALANDFSRVADFTRIRADK